MRMFHPSQRLSGRAYRIMRRLVQLICGGLVLWLGVAMYLNLFGVPKPVLRRIVSRINDAGIPVDIESIHLGLSGWRATNVRCYSRDPDDLKPVVAAAEVFLRKNARVKGGLREARGYDIKANGIRVSPSVEWGIGLLADSRLTKVEHTELSIALSPDSIVIKNGQVQWNAASFSVNGTVRLATAKEREAVESSQEQAFRAIAMDPRWSRGVEQVLTALAQSEEAAVDLDFLFDIARPASSRLICSAYVGAFEFRDVFFSKAELSASYEFPRAQLNHATLHKDNEMFGIEGFYDLDSKTMQASVSNDISTKKMFQLCPRPPFEFLSQYGIEPESFPSFDLQLGPANPAHLLENLSGSFLLRNTLFRDLKINSLRGKLGRKGSRLDISELKGTVAGQEQRADETGSSMRGGAATGEIVWDAAGHEFRVTAEGDIDPNLLLKPLADVRIATNVISRFKFNDEAPHLRVELGACYDNWRSFFINVQGSAEDMRFHHVPFTSMSASACYKEGVLSLDRLIAKQGVDFLKGSVSLDFRKGVASFDAMGSINPKTIEDAIDPRYGIFSKSVNVVGAAKISGRGLLDWRHMKATAFTGEVEAPRVELPMAALDHLTTTVTGEGPVILVGDAAFNIYGGNGDGTLSLSLDPLEPGTPYKVYVHINKADFKQFIKYIDPETESEATGELSGNLQAESDFSKRFFESANGAGRVKIKNGQLADLPFFSGFSNLMRNIIPSFKIFSINQLSGDFALKNGVASTGNAYFDGDLLSAKGRGRYSASDGFDAYVQAQVLSDNNVSKFFRFFTDPLLKLFEIKLEGTVKKPEWTINAFTSSEKNKAVDE